MGSNEGGQRMSKNQKKEQERYLKIPYRILNIGGLGLCEKVLLAYIYSFGDKGCWQSNATIAKVFFTNPRSVRRWIQRIHKYIYVKCPRGYYRTMWAKSHPDVRTGVKKWAEEEQKRKARSRQKKSTVVGQNSPTNMDKSGLHSRTDVAVEQGQIRPTIINHTIKEITKETTAPPTPLPAKGQPSAVLDDRKEESVAQVEQLKRKFGKPRRATKPPSQEEFDKRRREQQKALAAGANL